jgi:hypothetical protein
LTRVEARGGAALIDLDLELDMDCEGGGEHCYQERLLADKRGAAVEIAAVCQLVEESSAALGRR